MSGATAIGISASVGAGGINKFDDVELVQTLLNQNADRISGYTALKVDGKNGDKTVAAIKLYQGQVVGFQRPDGRVDANGTTWQQLSASAAPSESLTPTNGVYMSFYGPTTPPLFSYLSPMLPPLAPVAETPSGYTYFWHPKAKDVTLLYGERARAMLPNAETLLKSILASCEIFQATLTSTLRTYHDQARITMEQTYVSKPANVVTWYGQTVFDKCKELAPANDIQGFADWWKTYDTNRGRVSSKHLTNQAMDVVPVKERAKFATAVSNLVPGAGTGVRRIIPKGVLGEPVDHVEFTFQVCPALS